MPNEYYRPLHRKARDAATLISSVPPLMTANDYLKKVFAPRGRPFYRAADAVHEELQELGKTFDVNSIFKPRYFAAVAYECGFANAEHILMMRMNSDVLRGVKNMLDKTASRLGSAGVTILIRTENYIAPVNEISGERVWDTKHMLTATGIVLGGTAIGFGALYLAASACGIVSGIPAIPLPPMLTATPENPGGQSVGVCPNPNTLGDQSFSLAAVLPGSTSTETYHNITAADQPVIQQLETAANTTFGPKDIWICSPAYNGGVSPVITQYTVDKPNGAGTTWLLLDNGTLINAQTDTTLNTGPSWLKTMDAHHFSLGRVGEGKFDSIVYINPQLDPKGNEMITGILDRSTGKVLTGQAMIDKFGNQFSHVPFAIMASLNDFKKSVPATLASQVDHYGYIPTSTPNNGTVLQLAALNSNGSLVWPPPAIPQPSPIETDTPTSPTPPPSPSATPSLTSSPAPSPMPTLTTIPTTTRGPDTPTPVPNLLGTGPYAQQVVGEQGILPPHTALKAEITESGEQGSKAIWGVEILKTSKNSDGQTIGEFVFYGQDGSGPHYFYGDPNQFRGGDFFLVKTSAAPSGAVRIESLTLGEIWRVTLSDSDLDKVLQNTDPTHAPSVVLRNGAIALFTSRYPSIKELP